MQFWKKWRTCFEKVRLWNFTRVSFGMLMSPMNELFPPSTHDNKASEAFEFLRQNSILGIPTSSEIQKSLREKRATWIQICIFAPRNCVFSIFLLTAKWKLCFWNKSYYVVIHLVNWRKLVSWKTFSFCS